MQLETHHYAQFTNKHIDLKKKSDEANSFFMNRKGHVL